MRYSNIRFINLGSGHQLLGILIGFAGLVALVSPILLKSDVPLNTVILVGSGSLILGLLMISTFEGYLFDLKLNKIKKYLSFCGFKFGSWEPLPEISRIEVTSKTSFKTNIPNGVTPIFSGHITDYFTVLYSPDNVNPLYVFIHGSKKKSAIEKSKKLAQDLKVPITFPTPEN